MQATDNSKENNVHYRKQTKIIYEAILFAAELL